MSFAEHDTARLQEHPELLLGVTEEVLERFVGNHHVLVRAVAHAVSVSQLGRLAPDVSPSLSDVLDPDARRLLTWFLRHLINKELLFSCYERISAPGDAHRFIELVVSSPDTNHALLIEAFSDVDDLVRRVGDAETFRDQCAFRWLECGVSRRAELLLDEDPPRTLELIELIPMAMTPLGRSIGAVFGVSRAIAGAALDAGRLSEGSRALLLEVFPNDPYFAAKAQR